MASMSGITENGIPYLKPADTFAPAANLQEMAEAVDRSLSTKSEISLPVVALRLLAGSTLISTSITRVMCVKIGPIVFLSALIGYSVGSASGNIQLTGQPTVLSPQNSIGYIAVGSGIQGHFYISSGTASFIKPGGAVLQASDLPASGEIVISMNYEA